MGRRPKTEALQLSERVPIKMTPELKARLQARARELGMDTSDLVRSLIDRELAGENATVEAVAGAAARSALEAAGYEIRKVGGG